MNQPHTLVWFLFEECAYISNKSKNYIWTIYTLTKRKMMTCKLKEREFFSWQIYIWLCFGTSPKTEWQDRLFILIMFVLISYKANYFNNFHLWSFKMSFFAFFPTVLPTPVFHFTFYSPSSAVWLMIISVIYARDFHLKDHVSLNVFFLFILLLTHVISPLIWHHLTAHYTSMMWSVNIYNVHVIFIF